MKDTSKDGRASPAMVAGGLAASQREYRRHFPEPGDAPIKDRADAAIVAFRNPVYARMAAGYLERFFAELAEIGARINLPSEELVARHEAWYDAIDLRDAILARIEAQEDNYKEPK